MKKNKKQSEQDQILDGFSSQDDVRQQQIIGQQYHLTNSQYQIRQQVKFKVPPHPHPERTNKSYNLYPDTVTGWTPKVQLPSPIPLIYDNFSIERLINYIIKSKNNQIKVCYTGARYENTYFAWLNKKFPFPYGHIKAANETKMGNNLEKQQKGQNELQFDSQFQSGNLDYAIQVGQFQYELFIRVDSNTKGHLQWFNFIVKKMQKGVKYKFHICNFQKNKSLYSRGMKPYIYSKNKFQNQKIGWQQGADHVRYDKKPSKASIALNYNLFRSYRLSFELTTNYNDDIIQIAYCVPYTYTDLMGFIERIGKKYEKKGIMKVSKLCTSLGGLQVPLLTIHQKVEESNIINLQSETDLKKKCIIISGRAHPGQSNSSFMMHGFIDFILGDSKSAQYLRKHIEFKIVPMLNPDGVALGNYRTGISGRDYNREFRNPDKKIFPQVYAIKKLVSETKQIYAQKLLMFLDFHGHSVKKNVFVYGPQFPIIQRNYYESRIFPKLISNKTEMFRYYSCIFKVSQVKQSTARAVLLRRLNIPMTYTIEASNGSYYSYEKLADIPFNECQWKKMGNLIGESIEEYTNLVLIAEQIKMGKRKKRNLIKHQRIHKMIRSKKKQKINSSSMPQSSQNLQILPAIEDQKIKEILNQIKFAEDHKAQQRNSEDQISQGSSDMEPDTNNLTPQQTNFLFKIIKNNKPYPLSKCKFIQDEIQRFSTNQQNKHDINEEEDKLQIFRKEKLGRKSFVEKSKQKNNFIIKEELQRDRRNTKVLNFSFGSSSPARGKSLDEKTVICRKINLLDSLSGKVTQKNSVKNNLAESPEFIKTFTMKMRERPQYVQSKLQTVYINQNSRRFDEYRLKRIIKGSK